MEPQEGIQDSALPDEALQDTSVQGSSAQAASTQGSLTPTIDISPNIIMAYLANIGKVVLLIGGIVGGFYLVQNFLGYNPFLDVFDFVGVPIEWGLRALVAISVVLVVLAFFSTLSLTSYGLLIKDGKLEYSYGSFFKVTKSTAVSNILRVNLSKSAFGLGDLILELTGTEEKIITVQFVSDVEERCAEINNLIKKYKNPVVGRIDEEGV